MLDRQPDNHDRWPASPEGSADASEPGRGRTSGGSGRRGGRPTRPVTDLGRVRAVIDALPEAVFVTESDGELRLTNPAADRMFAGQPVADRADLLSRFEEVTDERGGSQPVPAVDDAARHVTVRPRNQPNRWFAMRTIPLDQDTLDEGLAGRTLAAPAAPAGDPDEPSGQTVFVLRDVTDSGDLRPVREAFLSVLSHELRTPITTIYAGSSVLARRPTLSPPATRILAHDISAEAARLYDLVEDLLVLARLERRVLEPIDEPVLVQRSVDAMVRMVADRHIDVAIERRGDSDVPPVHGDATYVEQACRNLILSSVRYAGPDPDHALVVELRTDAWAGEVSVAVLDRGPKLSASELDQAFELPDPSAIGRLAGAGVGPFVCRHLVEAMGGRTWARNRPDGAVEMGFALRIDERG